MWSDMRQLMDAMPCSVANTALLSVRTLVLFFNDLFSSLKLGCEMLGCRVCDALFFVTDLTSPATVYEVLY